ncbi:agmatinase [Enterococcus sp.]|uniref:agmatinase n=1 Tax=Enterococcus sp. TaxID=35783 RepID=UPI00289ABBAF|nr:agmatinase [Enterococcus sp.]
MKRIEILSTPYEEGIYWRKGAKKGPEEILRKFRETREYSIYNDNSIDKESISYVNDLYLSPYDNESALKNIENSILNSLNNNNFPICLGGDHSITYAIVKAFSQFYGKGDFGIIQFDSHTDTFDDIDGFKYHHGATFRNIVEEGYVKEENIIQFGIRGQVRKDSLHLLYSKKRKTVTMKELVRSNFDFLSFIENKSIPYYVSFDIDFIDPAFAPGTGTPVPGGASSFDTLKIINHLTNLNIIGFDLVEVSPQYDNSEITVLLAANIIHELITSYTVEDDKEVLKEKFI